MSSTYSSAWLAPLPILEPLALVSHRVVTTSAIEPNTALISIPQSLLLSKDDAQSTALLRFLDPEDGPRPPGLPHWAALPDVSVLALQLALRNDQLAATQRLNGTWHWTATEQEALEGSHAFRHAAEHSKRLDGHLEALLRPLQSSAPEFFSGAAFAASRVRALHHWVAAHAVQPSPSGRTILLPLPLLRMRPRGAVTLHHDAASGDVTLRAARRLETGDEITLDCGRHGHAQLLLRQGDVGISAGECAAAAHALHVPRGDLGIEPRRPGEGGPPERNSGFSHVALPLTLSIEDDDALAGSKAALLQKASLSAVGQTFELRGGEPPPRGLLPYARLAVLAEHELPLMPDGGELPAAPLTPSNEEYAFRHVARAIDAMLAMYPTTAEEDEYDLGESLSRAAAGGADRRARGGGGAAARARAEEPRSSEDERRRAALCATLLEKRLLTATIGALSAEVSDYTQRATQPSAAEAAAVGGNRIASGGERRRKKKNKKRRGTRTGAPPKTEL